MEMRVTEKFTRHVSKKINLLEVITGFMNWVPANGVFSMCLMSDFFYLYQMKNLWTLHKLLSPSNTCVRIDAVT